MSSSDEKNNVERPKTEFYDEWFKLQELLMLWRDGEPEKHVLYKQATACIPTDQSLEYYQGVYHTLCAMCPILELVLKPGFTKNPHSAMIEILQLQTGFAISQILARWPRHLTPRITERGSVRAKRSTYKDAEEEDKEEAENAVLEKEMEEGRTRENEKQAGAGGKQEKRNK